MENLEQETSRKLASIQKVLKVEKIEGADKIEKVTILGWECVCKVDEYSVDDLVIYFEVDSLLPREVWNEFLFHNDKKEFRLKTIKLRGQVSQGLVMPLSILPNEFKQLFSGCEKEGCDVTKVLKVKKHVPYIPAQLMGQVKGTRPEFVPKTDEPRIQGEPKLLEKYKGKMFYVTEKLDGSSMSVYYNKEEFGVCSRNMDLKETEGNSFWKVARELDLENKLKKYGKNIVLQGELWGNGIQGNKLKSEGSNFSIFNIYNVDERKYLDFGEFLMIVGDLGLKTVPIVEFDFILNHTVPELIEYSIGKSAICREVQREGLVFRPLIEERDRSIGRLSFKAINSKFLIKYGE